MKDFMKGAKGLATNPLGIIALFISLIYGFACLVLAFGKNAYDCAVIFPLVYFIVFFPILILISFIFLVVFHHQKLYAPMDYRYEDNFFKIIDKNRQNERLENEIAEIESAEDNFSNDQEQTEELDLHDKVDDTQNKNSASVQFRKTGIGGIKKAKDPDVKKIAVPSNFSGPNVDQLKKFYLLTEELAIKKLEHEYNVNIFRQVQLNIGNETFEVDGLCKLKNRTLLFEIKYVKGNLLSAKVIKSFERMADLISLEKDIKLKLVVVIVHGSSFGEKLRDQLYKVFKNNKFIEFKFYNIDKLQEAFISR